MNKSSTSFWRVLWQTTALVLVIVLTTVLLGGAYKQYYSTVYPLKFEAEVSAASGEFDIAPSLIYAVIYTESSFEPQATSSADAKGLMQLTDSTLQWALNREGNPDKYAPDALYEPSVNIHYGVYVLALLGEQFENVETVLAAYNAGQGRVAQWLDDSRYSSDGVHLHSIPYEETANYVRRVLATQKRYQQLYSIP
ncbi:MAG: lytic transglycosylase domain-containing protein [Clostridia bacterium]|nr:lytic transglycosylase domain-containing protein [Clostridia bacterium]